MATEAEQKVFDFVATKLIEQGQPALGKMGCAYKDDAGRRCAAGWLMTDEEIKELEASDNLMTIFTMLPEHIYNAVLIRYGVNPTFIGRLQGCHDIATQGLPEPWLPVLKRHLKDLAEGYSLSTAVLEE